MFRAILLLLTLLLILAGCGGDSPSHPNDYLAVTSLSVTATNSSLIIGTNSRFTATAQLENGQQRDVTDHVDWVSSNPDVAYFGTTDEARNLLNALSSGAVTVSIQYAGLNSELSVVVENRAVTAVEIFPKKAVLPSQPSGITLAYRAIASLSDGNTLDVTESVDWSVSVTDTENDVATIGNSSIDKGLATVRDVGDATIAATFGIVPVESSSLTVANGELRGLRIVRVTGTESTEEADVDSGGEDQSDDSVVEIFSKARFKTEAWISDAVSQSEDSDFWDVTAQTVWQSTNPEVAVIAPAPNEDGSMEVSALQVGSTTLFADFQSFRVGLALTVEDNGEVVPVSLRIEPSSVSLAQFTRRQVRLIVTYNNGATRDLASFLPADSWTIDDPDIASVETDRGITLVHGRASGSTVLSVRLED
ncbi:MAG: hypothetical protein C0614_01680, partial [Desulfuromonas sp.]